jgi:hypothetical protein
MLDKCTISAGNPIFLSPALIAQPEAFLLHRTVRLSNIQFTTPSYWRNGIQVITKECLIRVLPAGTLDVKAVADAPTGTDDQPNYRISKFTFNLSSLLHSHNGIVIQSSRQLCFALSLLRHILGGLLMDPRQAALLIPGVAAQGRACWQSIEVCLNLPDPDGAILHGMMSMSSKLIRLQPICVRNETITLQGTRLKLNAYRKDLQMAKKHTGCMAGGPVTRLELGLYLNKYPDAFNFLDTDARPTTKLLDGKHRLTCFNLGHLIAIHRHHFADLRGVYHTKAGPNAPGTFKVAATLANIAREFVIPVSRLLQIHFDTTACKPSTRTDLRKQAADCLEQDCKALDANVLLSDEAYANQPGVEVEGLHGYARLFNVAAPDSDINRAYGSPAPTMSRIISI